MPRITPAFYWKAKINPRFDLAKIWGRFESVEMCKKHNRHLIRSLENTGCFQDVVTALKSCRKGKRCWHPECAVCRRRYRRLWAASILEQFEDEPVLCMLTYIPDPKINGPTPTDADVKRMIERLITRIKRLVGRNIKVAGHAEISYHFRYDCLLPHVHLICAAPKAKLLKVKNKAKDLKPDRVIYRPIEISVIKFKDRAEVVSYVCKQFGAKRPYRLYVPKRRKPFVLPRRRLGPDYHARERLKMTKGYKMNSLAVYLSMSAR